MGASSPSMDNEGDLYTENGCHLFDPHRSGFSWQNLTKCVHLRLENGKSLVFDVCVGP